MRLCCDMILQYDIINIKPQIPPGYKSNQNSLRIIKTTHAKNVFSSTLIYCMKREIWNGKKQKVSEENTTQNKIEGDGDMDTRLELPGKGKSKISLEEFVVIHSKTY